MTQPTTRARVFAEDLSELGVDCEPHWSDPRCTACPDDAAGLRRGVLIALVLTVGAWAVVIGGYALVQWVWA